MATGSAINLFGSVVHDATPPTAAAINLYASVVHNATPPTAAGINLFGSVVHDATPPTAAGINLFGSVVHNTAQISGTVADITGTVGNPATFDGTPMGVSTSSVNYQWSWQSVPLGSAIANATFPLPDNGSTTPVNMFGNVGLWHLNGVAGDSSGLANMGSIYGAPATVPGKIGTALDFNGSSDYIDIPNNVTLNSNVGTISLWVKFTSSTTPMSIISKNDISYSRNGWHLYIDGSRPSVQIKDAWMGTTTLVNPTASAINDGDWHHIVVVFESGGTSKIYVDNVERVSNPSTVSFTVTNSQPMRIAKNVDTWWNEFAGSIDEVSLWNRVLSPLEIDQIYFFQSGSCASGSVGLGETFSFTPDVSGTYSIELGLTDGASMPISGNVDAVISDSPPTPPTGSVITGSNPTVNLVESKSLGYIFNTYKIQNLSVQRSRTSEQVPFKLGTKGKQSLRNRTNSEFTGSS